ncbi:MAG: hypothetical protein WCK77_10075 [Verrucomicrobiota bacterium]
MSSWQSLSAHVVAGHRVASGANGNPRFPGGTLHMQAPYFKALGVDLGAYHPGTLNVSIAPCRYSVRCARQTFRNIKWHPVEPAEDFSFFDVRLIRPDAAAVVGLIYFPHPDTKPEHFQQPDVLELLLPFVEGLDYGAELRLEIPADQMLIECPGLA